MTDALERRVHRLERRNRALMAGFAFSAIGLVTCGGGGVTSNFERVNTRVLDVKAGDGASTLTLRDGTITFQGAGGPVTLDAETVTQLRALLAEPAAASK